METQASSVDVADGNVLKPIRDVANICCGKPLGAPSAERDLLEIRCLLERCLLEIRT